MDPLPPSSASPATRVNPLVRGLYALCGLGCVAVGGLGVVVPGLPTTPLLIAAAWLFARSSPTLERWVLELPGVGAIVADHRNGLGIPLRTKVLAITMMSVAVSVSVVLALQSWPVRAVVLALGATGAWYVGLRLPTRRG